MNRLLTAVLLLALLPAGAEAKVVRLQLDRREPVLNGKPFGLAGAYEKLVGIVYFALDPKAPINRDIVDLDLASRNARGWVEFSADFYLLKPKDPSRGNGRLLYEVGNRGNKATLRVFQKSEPGADPKTEPEFGDGALMSQGFSLLWMGWQWDVPDGLMRMDMPVATAGGKPSTGLVRGNIIVNTHAGTALVADRGHKAYAPVNPDSADDFMTVRDHPTDAPQRIDRGRWKWAGTGTVVLDGGFEPGRIYDVVYRAANPKVIGCGLAGTRDLISFFKNAPAPGNPLPGTRTAYGWGVSQSGRFLRHFLFQGFNEDEAGRRVFDGVIDEVGGAGRGSFNHRFGQASRDAEQHLNIIFYPVDMFPFTDAPETDPETGETGALLARADARHVTPKLFHVLSNSEYFNRAGALVHTDPAGRRDIEPPPDSRIYVIASGPHYPGGFPPSPNAGGDLVGQALLNPLDRTPVIRALFQAMDAWVTEGKAPPPSRFPRLSDGTLTAPEAAGWPVIPGVHLPPPMLITYRLDFGPDWPQGIVSHEPPHVGKTFAVLVPAVDKDGNGRAGIRLPEVQAPLGSYAGWNYRATSLGAADQLAGEAGSFHPFLRTKGERAAKGDPRLSLEERYGSRDEYLGRVTAAARQLVADRLMLAQDLPGVLDHALRYYDWAMGRSRRTF